MNKKEKQLLFIHETKTAALIQASMMTGAILAGASEREVERIERCAYNIGIAFQIQDDILDVVGDEKELGKPIVFVNVSGSSQFSALREMLNTCTPTGVLSLKRSRMPSLRGALRI